MTTPESIQKYINLEIRLAELMGWTDVRAKVGSEHKWDARLMGNPPPDAEIPYRCEMPRWARDWSAAGPLIGMFGLEVYADTHPEGCDCVEVKAIGNPASQAMFIANFADFNNRDEAIIFSVASTAANRLEELKALQKPA